MWSALGSQTGGRIARTWGKGRPKEGAAAWTRPACGCPAQGPMLSIVGEVKLLSMTLKGRHFRNFKPVHCEGVFYYKPTWGNRPYWTEAESDLCLRCFWVCGLGFKWGGEMLPRARPKVFHGFLTQSTAISTPRRYIVTLINLESGRADANVWTHHPVGFEEIIIFVTDVFSGSSFFLLPFSSLCVSLFSSVESEF